MVVSNIFYFHPYLGKIPILTNIFQRGWFNHQPDDMSFCCHDFVPKGCSLAKGASDAGTEEEDQPSSSKARAGRGAILPVVLSFGWDEVVSGRALDMEMFSSCLENR